MKAIILDSRADNGSNCFLCRLTLEEYVVGLPQTYRDYEIQREIVNNVYLDRLVDTVLLRRHIPPIVLVVEAKNFNHAGREATFKTFKILDGLQRTFRLQAIKRTVDFCVQQLDKTEDYTSWNKFKLSREFSETLRKMDSNTEILRSVLEYRKRSGENKLRETFSENTQWFEIWTGLSPTDEVGKMLTLNAGHKPVKIRHQLELLFLNLLPTLQQGMGADFKLVREKEVSATQFSKNRSVGSFHFAHILTSLLSLHDGKAVAPTTSLVQSIQSSEAGIEEYQEITTPKFLIDFVSFLVSLDRLLSAQYPSIGVLWMGREISLSGLFGALGAFSKEFKQDRSLVMKKLLSVVEHYPNILDLQDFENQRNNLDLSKVNIGNVNRNAVFNAVLDLLNNPKPRKVDWRRHFHTED